MEDGSLWLSGSEFWDESNASRPPLKIADDLMLPSTEEVQLIELEHPVESYHLGGLNSNQKGQDLIGYYLNNYNFSFYDFTDANLSNSNLSGTDLTGANFMDANLTDANLTGATFYQTIMPDGQIRTGDVISDFNTSDSYTYWSKQVDAFGKSVVYRPGVVFFLKEDMTLWAIGRRFFG